MVDGSGKLRRDLDLGGGTRPTGGDIAGGIGVAVASTTAVPNREQRDSESLRDGRMATVSADGNDLSAAVAAVAATVAATTTAGEGGR